MLLSLHFAFLLTNYQRFSLSAQRSLSNSEPFTLPLRLVLYFSLSFSLYLSVYLACFFLPNEFKLTKRSKRERFQCVSDVCVCKRNVMGWRVIGWWFQRKSTKSFQLIWSLLLTINHWTKLIVGIWNNRKMQAQPRNNCI